MTVKQQLIDELESIDNSVALVQLYELVQAVKQSWVQKQSKALLSRYSGCLNDEDTQALKAIINNEFSKIEGEW